MNPWLAETLHRRRATRRTLALRVPLDPRRLVGYAALWLATNLFAADAPTPAQAEQATVILVVGAAGEPEYGSNFVRQADQWVATCRKAQCHPITIGREEPGTISDSERLRQAIEAEPKEGPTELWLVLLGHGTFDGQEARFNLRGPDLSAAELALWLRPFRRPLAVIDTASASAPFLRALSATNRVIVTATRSGYEQNFTRFGQFLAEAIDDPQSDLDADGQVSLLEAFLAASHRVTEFYKAEGRLPTEHALIDDNGDGLGTPADWFRGVRAIKKPDGGAALDGVRARQFHLVRSVAEQQLPAAARAQRDELELAISRLREAKEQMPADDYYRRLDALLLNLARLYEPNSPAP